VIANFPNLRFLDLSNTAVTSTGVKELMKLEKLESLNLTETRVRRNGITELQAKPGLKDSIHSKRADPFIFARRAREQILVGQRPGCPGEGSSPAAGASQTPRKRTQNTNLAGQEPGGR